MCSIINNVCFFHKLHNVIVKIKILIALNSNVIVDLYKIMSPERCVKYRPNVGHIK